METVDTLTDTVRLGKTTYAISSVDGLVSGETVYGKAVLDTGEDGLEEGDYIYPVLRTGYYVYSDTDDDDLVDCFAITFTDTGSPAETVETESYLPGAARTFSEGYGYSDDSVVSHYDLSGRLEYSCHDYADHGVSGHTCESYTYSLAGRTLSQTSKYGLVTTMQYNPSGEVSRTVYPDGHVTENSRWFVYDPQNPGDAYFTATETDYGMNYTKLSRYNCLGQVIYEDIVTAGEWLYLEYTYNDLGLNLTRTDSTGNVTTYVFDSKGRTLTETTVQVTGPDLVTTYTYNDDGEILTETDPYGNTVTYVYETYFDKRLLSKTTVVNGETTVEDYDYLLDANSEYTLTTTYPDSTQTVTKLQSGGQTSSISKDVSWLSSDATGMERTFTYSSGQLSSMGNNGFEYVFTYNEDGELSEIAVSDGVNSQTIVTMASTEDEAGNTADTTSYGNGQSVIRTTDASGRLEKIEHSTGGTTSTKYEYVYSSEDTSPNDLDGQELTTVTDHVNGQTVTYGKTADEYSFTKETIVRNTATMAQIYAYTVLNTEDEITLVTEIAGTTQPYTYSKDDAGRLSSTVYTLPGGGATIEKTDSFGGYGELAGSATEIGAQALLGYAYTYRTVSGTAFTGQVAQESLQYGLVNKAYNYTYDDNGNITKITRTIGGVTTDLYRYVYDEAGQIIREDNVPYGITFTWQYDKGGNIVIRKYHTLTAEGGTPGLPLLTLPYSYSTGLWKDQLTSYSGQSIIYDNAGNPTTYMGKTLAWTMGRQLESYTSGGITTSYKYNDSGIRTRKTVGSVITDYALNGTQILAQTVNGVRTDFRYDGNGKLIAIRYNGTEYYYMSNILGDVTGFIDSNGTSVVEYNYDAWGKIISTTGTLATTLGQANPFRYRGYYFDTESGFYYLQSRYYDPNTGRFISADDTSILQMTQGELLGGNLYAYCGNCPILYTDPLGDFGGIKKLIFDDIFAGRFICKMTYVTKDQLIKLKWNNVTDKMVKSFNTTIIKFDITTPDRIRHFLSQVMQESSFGKYTKEIADGSAYEGRMDLGNTQPGDGQKYKGAGYLQMTGRANYQAFSNFIGDKNIMKGADYVAKNYPWEAAGFWWKNNRMNEIVDSLENASISQSTLEVSRAVNCGNRYSKIMPNGYKNRKAYYEMTLKVIR
ncbi:MAG: RHS repeat-associated core domain-containing protein [Saccharofermentanales bacterium]